MPKAYVFWGIFLILLLFGGWYCYGQHVFIAPFGIVMVLVALLGWAVFGAAVK